MSALPLRPRDLFATLALVNSGVMVLALQPLILGPLVSGGLISEAMLGWLAFAETLAIALSSTLCPRWLAGKRINGLLWLSAFALSALDLASVYAVGPASLLVLRCLAGLLEGLLLSGAVLMTLSAANPDKINAICLAGSTIISGAISYFLPTYVVPVLGARWAFAVLLVPVAAASIGLVLRGSAPAGPLMEEQKEPLTGPAWLVLGAVLLQNAAAAAAWAFLALSGEMAGFTAAQLGLAASLGLGAQVLGPLWMANYTGRWPAYAVLAVACLVQGVGALFVGAPQGAWVFIAASMVMGFVWIGGFPVAFRLALSLGKGPRAAILCVPAQMIGLAIGPALAGTLVSAQSLMPAYSLSAALALSGAALALGLRSAPVTNFS